jgi:hypothetical protein
MVEDRGETINARRRDEEKTRNMAEQFTSTRAESSRDIHGRRRDSKMGERRRVAREIDEKYRGPSPVRSRVSVSLVSRRERTVENAELFTESRLCGREEEKVDGAFD